MGKKLRELVINRIDVVDKGDNPKAHILLFKNEGGQLNNNVNINNKKGDDYIMTIEEILAKLPQEDQDLLKVELESRKGEVDILKTEADTKDKAVEDIKKKLTDAETALKEADGKIVKEEPKIKDEDVIKKAGPEAEKVFKEMQERLEKSETEGAENTKKVDELSTKIQKRDFMEKAETFKGLGETTEDLTEILMDISNKAPESYEKLEKLLEKTNKAIEEGELLKVQGSSASGDAGDAETEIRKGAEEIAKRDKISPEQAELKLLEEKPELYEKYEKEKGV